MGGKSTLLRFASFLARILWLIYFLILVVARQACILVIMAQMGALVPAQSMKLTIVDQIFTRLGPLRDFHVFAVLIVDFLP